MANATDAWLRERISRGKLNWNETRCRVRKMEWVGGELQVVKTMAAKQHNKREQQTTNNTGKSGKCRGNRKELKTELPSGDGVVRRKLSLRRRLSFAFSRPNWCARLPRKNMLNKRKCMQKIIWKQQPYARATSAVSPNFKFPGCIFTWISKLKVIRFLFMRSVYQGNKNALRPLSLRFKHKERYC